MTMTAPKRNKVDEQELRNHMSYVAEEKEGSLL